MGEDRVGIITGAASGMGMALAKHFSAKGWRLALFDINDKVGEELALSLGPETAFFHHVDVSSYSSQAEGFLAVHRRWGRIDALLANAGIVDQSSLYLLGDQHRTRAVDDVPPAPSTLCTDVDFKGVLYGVQLCVHFMRHNPPPIKGGRIVITASVAAVRPHPSYPEYNGAKAAAVNFARGMAPLLRARENISVNVVCPGIVATAIVPPEMVAAVEPRYLTPVDTIVGAYAQFLDPRPETEEEQKKLPYGAVVEGSVDRVLELEEPKLANGAASDRSVTVWEPLFKMLHGENSGLQGAIS